MVPGRIWLLFRMLPSVAALSVGTACRDAQEQARTVVLDAGFRFTIADYLKAAAEGRGAVVGQFLTVGMRVDAAALDGRTALRMAAGGGHAHLVQQLLAAGASPDVADDAGVTPLMASAAVGDAVSVQALRAAGAEPARVDSQGHNALMAAAAGGHAGVVDLLVPETGGSLGEVLLLACSAGHTGVIDGILKADRTGSRASLDWPGLLKAAASGGHLPAVKLLSSRMPATFESGNVRLNVASAARESGKVDVAGFLEAEAALTVGAQQASATVGATHPVGATGEGPSAGDTLEQPSTMPVSMVPADPPARLGQARFPMVNCETMAQIPEVLMMTAWEPQVWPIVLEDVAPGHESAEITLTGAPLRKVTLKVGDEIPGTDGVVEKLRRRRLYTDSSESVLKNSSELHFRRAGTQEIFQAMAGERVLSNDSSAHLRITGVERTHTAVPGDAFRLGSLLLRVSRIAAGAITVENRLTGETLTLPLTENP